MKRLKVLTLGSLLMCSGLMFAGCGGEELKTFDAANFEVGSQTTVYNGQEQFFAVNGYAGATVTYSKDNKQTFVSAEDLDLKDAGTYTVYYKVSQEGYEDYISEAQTFKINPKPITVTISTISDFVANAKTAEQIVNNLTLYYSQGTIVPGDTLNIDYTVEDYETDTDKQAGDSYVISGVDSDNNYAITINNGLYKLIDAVSIADTYYSSFQEALAEAEAGDVISLHTDVELDSQIQIQEAITIDGNGIYAIKASASFDGSVYVGKQSMLTINSLEAGESVTFKNVILDGSNKTRILHANSGKVIIDGANITNGRSANFIGGVYITEEAEFEMRSGSIMNNHVSEEYENDGYCQYSADLWIGSEAQGKLSSQYGGRIGSVFVNSNEFSTEKSGFEFAGGTIENVYVEYDKGNGGKFTYTSGLLSNLYISSLASGEGVKVTPVTGNSYVGGVVATAKLKGITKEFNKVEDAIAYVLENPTAYMTAYLAGEDVLNQVAQMAVVNEIVLINDVVLTTNLVVNRKLTINLNGKTIKNTQDIYKTSTKVWSLISVREGGDLTVTGNGTLMAKDGDCYAIDVREGANLLVENGTYIGNISAIYAYEGTVTINDGTFDVQQLSEITGDSRYTLNCYDKHAGTTATIVVNGGTFANYNPAFSNSENPATKFVVEGKTTEASEADENGDIWYTVVNE